jgi:FG-GAP repeat
VALCFIYRRTASGDVALQQEIDTEAVEQRAALDRGTLLVSAVDLRFPARYRVEVYTLTDQGAVPVQTLLPSDVFRGETFGDSLSISGDVAVIGAPFSERRGGCGFMSDRFGAGNAFVCERDHDGVWKEVALLSNPDCGWFFGGNTATDGKRILSSANYSSRRRVVWIWALRLAGMQRSLLTMPAHR